MHNSIVNFFNYNFTLVYFSLKRKKSNQNYYPENCSFQLTRINHHSGKLKHTAFICNDLKLKSLLPRTIPPILAI